MSTTKTTIADLERAFPDLDRESELRLDFDIKRELQHTWFSRNGQFVLMVITDPQRTRSPIVTVFIGDPSGATTEGARPIQTVGEIARIYP